MIFRRSNFCGKQEPIREYSTRQERLSKRKYFSLFCFFCSDEVKKFYNIDTNLCARSVSDEEEKSFMSLTPGGADTLPLQGLFVNVGSYDLKYR